MKCKHNYNSSLIIKDSEFKYYFIGLVAADGWISKKSNRIEITLKESDFDYLEILRKNLTNRSIVYKQNQKAYRLIIEDSLIKKEIMKYINCYDKTYNLIFPPGINHNNVRHFMRGYLDGDGNISVKMSYKKVKGVRKSYPGLRLRILGTKSFLFGYAITLRNIGLVNFTRNPSKKHESNVYYIEYAFASAKRILTWLYSNCDYYLSRKKKVFELINTSDSDQLIEFYNTYRGHYNTQTSKQTKR